MGAQRKWQDLYLANRLVVVVSVIASCLIRLYGTTRRRLKERNSQLQKVEAEQRILRLHEQDFERAREIQEALMPTQLPRIRGCELAAGCKPARNVGGDYYGAIAELIRRSPLSSEMCPEKAWLPRCSLSNLQAIVRTFAHAGLKPSELCAKANELIVASVATGKYITFFYAVVDIARMRLDYCNAGHNPPLLQHRDGTMETLGEGGPVLGVFPDARYSGGIAKLRPDDCLVLLQMASRKQ